MWYVAHEIVVSSGSQTLYSVYWPDGTVILHAMCHIGQEGQLSSSIALIG